MHNEKVDNFEENLNARVTAIKNGECLEITIPEGIGESAFLSENAIKIIQLVSKLECSKLRIISAKKDVNDTETDNVLKNDPKGESLLNKKLQRSEFKGSGGKRETKNIKQRRLIKDMGRSRKAKKLKEIKYAKNLKYR